MDWSNLAEDRDMWWALVIINSFHSTIKWTLTTHTCVGLP